MPAGNVGDRRARSLGPVRASTRVAALDVALAGLFLVVGTLSLVTHGLLAWVWLVFGAAFTAVAFLWARAGPV